MTFNKEMQEKRVLLLMAFANEEESKIRQLIAELAAMQEEQEVFCSSCEYIERQDQNY